ncbi:MAG: phosphoribosylaminoimidazolesuccinocarboxamide synthase [Candidatus Dormibacteria bacterium]
MAESPTAPESVGDIELLELPLFRRGKVRDTFDLGDRLLMVATDRISAFDCVLQDLIPHKGVVLTQMSKHWFRKTQDLVPNHLLPDDPPSVPGLPPAYWERTMLVRRAERVDIECVVRGRLAGSGWVEYQERGTLADEPLPPGLVFGQELPDLRFTPATKNDEGHDENISRSRLGQLVGVELGRRLEELSLRLFRLARVQCQDAGFILVDSKFEFGFIEGQLCLIDEVLTPDSSRLWEVGAEAEAQPHGFDKQPVRDYLISTGWDRRPPAPRLPQQLIQDTSRRYQEAARRVTKSDS